MPPSCSQDRRFRERWCRDRPRPISVPFQAKPMGVAEYLAAKSSRRSQSVNQPTWASMRESVGHPCFLTLKAINCSTAKIRQARPFAHYPKCRLWINACAPLNWQGARRQPILTGTCCRPSLVSGTLWLNQAVSCQALFMAFPFFSFIVSSLIQIEPI